MPTTYSATLEIHRLKKDGFLDEGAPKVCFKVSLIQLSISFVYIIVHILFLSERWTTI